MTMQINRDNYGAYFLDYWESNLDEQGRSALTRFLDQNPDLLDEFLDFNTAVKSKLDPDKAHVFTLKHKLKKPVIKPLGEINQDNFEEFIIASLENDLDNGQQDNFDDFVKLNPDIKPEIALYQKTFLKPDKNIVFETKPGLKQPAIPFWWTGNFKRAVSVAAMLAVAVGLFRLSLIMFTSDIPNPEIAQTPAQHESTSDAGLTIPLDLVTPLRINLATNPLTELSPLTVEHPAHRLLSTSIDEARPFGGTSATTVNGLTGRASVNAIANVPDFGQPELRNEFSPVFDYLLLRDGIAHEAEKQQNVFSRLIAGVGDLFGAERDQQLEQFVQPVFEAFTDRGRDLITIAGDSFPVYRTTDESGRKEVYFALNDNFNILLSRGKPVNE
jgi:hypothetical protein